MIPRNVFRDAPRGCAGVTQMKLIYDLREAFIQFEKNNAVLDAEEASWSRTKRWKFQAQTRKRQNKLQRMREVMNVITRKEII